MEGETWMRIDDLMTITQRDTLSCIILKLKDEDAYSNLEEFVFERLDLELVAMRETEYYKKLSAFYSPIKIMTWITAVLIASGAIFGGINIMFAAFISRKKELATLQAVGYSRISLFFSILQEALLVNFAGTLVAMTLCISIFSGIKIAFTTGVFAMTFTPGMLVLGIISGAALAVAGCLIPAWKCLMPPLSSNLR